MNRSIHTEHIDDIYDVPMVVLNRPIIPVLDENKVQSMMKIVQQRGELTPIDVMWVEYEGKDYYFAFGGCHRYEAHKRLGMPTIRAKLIKTPPSVISDYMGSSSPFKSK